MRISRAKDLKYGQWILFQDAWWRIDKVEETDLVEGMVILHMHIPKEHFPDRVAPIQEFNLWANMMVPKNYNFEFRKGL